MKRILVAVIVLIVFAIAASSAPFWFGMEAEKSYQHLLERSGKDSGLTFANRDYTRGWLGSNAETVISMRGLPLELTATHHIQHGPLPFKKLLAGELDFTPVQAIISSRITLTAKAGDAKLKEALAQLPALKANTVIHLDGNSTTQLEIAAKKQSAEDGSTLDWRGLTGELRSDRDWKQLELTLHSPGATFTPAAAQAATGGVALTNLRVRANLQEGVAGYYLGRSDIELERLSAANGAFRLEGLGVNGDTRDQGGGNLQFRVGYRLKAIQFGTESHGPGELVIEARNLDAAVLRKFEQELNAMQQKNLPPQQVQMMMAGKMMELVGQLAKKSPELEVSKLSFKTGGGEITGRAKVVIDGKSANIAENPMLLLTAINGDAELSLPPSLVKPALAPLIEKDLQASAGRRGGLSAKELAALTPEAKARIVEQAMPMYLPKHPLTRWLVADGERYKLVATLRNGQLLVNGEPFNPSAGAVAPMAKRPAEPAAGKAPAKGVKKSAAR